MGWIPRWGSLRMAFPSVSVPLFVPEFPLDRSNSGLKFWRWVWGPINQGAMPNLRIWSPQSLPSLCRLFQVMISLWGPARLLLSWHLGLFVCYPNSPSPLWLWGVPWDMGELTVLYPHWLCLDVRLCEDAGHLSEGLGMGERSLRFRGPPQANRKASAIWFS